MAASASDLLQEVGIATATTLDSNYTIGDTTLTVASTSGMPTATGITIAVDVVDSNGDQVPGSYNEYVCVVATGTSLASLSHQNGTNRNYSAGATTRVYLPVSEERENRIVEWGLVHGNQDGTLKTDVAITTANATLTNPKVTTGINDTNGNELIKVTPTASAVNEITVTNAATGNAPSITATGGDTNVGLTVTPKGTGKLTLNNVFIPYKFRVSSPSTSVSSSAVIVKFATEAYDTGSNYDPATGLFVAPVAGFYEFSATIILATSNGGNNLGAFYFYKNGGNAGTLGNWAVGAISSNVGGTGTFTLELAASDNISIYAQNSIATSYTFGTFEGRLVSIS